MEKVIKQQIGKFSCTTTLVGIPCPPEREQEYWEGWRLIFQLVRDHQRQAAVSGCVDAVSCDQDTQAA